MLDGLVGSLCNLVRPWVVQTGWEREPIEDPRERLEVGAAGTRAGEDKGGAEPGLPAHWPFHA